MPDQGNETRPAEGSKLVLQFGAGTASMAALEAAVTLARAFDSRMESLFVENEELMSAALIPFTREIPVSGNAARILAPDVLTAELQKITEMMQRRLDRMAAAAHIPLAHRVLTGGTETALVSESESADFVALTEPLEAATSLMICNRISRLVHVRGFLLVGPGVATRQGPVVTAIEAAQDAERLLRQAVRLADSVAERLLVLPMERDRQLSAVLKQVISRLPATGSGIEMLPAQDGTAANVLHTVRRLKGGFFVTQLGGRLIPGEEHLTAFLAGLGCPLFLLGKDK